METAVTGGEDTPKSFSVLRKNGFYRLWCYDGQIVTRREDDQIFVTSVVREGERLLLAGITDATHCAVVEQSSAPLAAAFSHADQEFAYLIDERNISELEECVVRLRALNKNNLYILFKHQDTMAKAAPLIFALHEKYADFHFRFSSDHAVLLGFAYGRPLSPPRRAVIEIHEHCNLKCDFCWTHSPLLENKEGDGGRKVAIDETVFYKYIDELAAIPVDFVELCAIGDPLYHPKIWDMIRYVKQKGLRVRIGTNATLIGKKNAEDIIRWGVDELYINVSAGDGRSYADIHNVSEKIFENLKKNLCYLAAMKTKSPGCPLTMEHVNVITEKNAYSIPGMLHFAHMAGAAVVNMRTVWEHKDFLRKLNLKKSTVDFLLARIAEYSAQAEAFNIKHNFAEFAEQLKGLSTLNSTAEDAARVSAPPPDSPHFDSIPEIAREDTSNQNKSIEMDWLKRPLKTSSEARTEAHPDIPLCSVSYQFTLLGTGDLLRYCCRGDKVLGAYTSLKEQWVGETYNNFRDQWRQSYKDKKSLCVGCPHVEENHRYAKLLKMHNLRV